MILPPPRDARKFAESAEIIFQGRSLEDLVQAIDDALDEDLTGVSWSDLSRRVGAAFGTGPDVSVFMAVIYLRHRQKG